MGCDGRIALLATQNLYHGDSLPKLLNIIKVCAKKSLNTFNKMKLQRLLDIYILLV